KYGRLPWEALVQPAVELALKGFPLTRKEARSLNHIQDELKQHNSVMPSFLIRDEWHEGDTIVWEDLGHTLALIRDHGRDGFYKGVTADNIVAEMQRGNGAISHEDLAAYEAVWREPVTGTYQDYRIISMGPPSSGGVALTQLLNAVEPYPLSVWGHNEVATVHLLTEAERRVYADRATWLGDPDFSHVPVATLISEAYTRERMADFDADRATPSSTISAGDIVIPESHET